MKRKSKSAQAETEETNTSYQVTLQQKLQDISPQESCSSTKEDQGGSPSKRVRVDLCMDFCRWVNQALIVPSQLVLKRSPLSPSGPPAASGASCHCSVTLLGQVITESNLPPKFQFYFSPQSSLTWQLLSFQFAVPINPIWVSANPSWQG